jgi:hypothetical protein
MKTKLIALLVVLFASVFANSAKAVSYSGSLSAVDGGLFSTSEWQELAIMSWTVTNDGFEGNWNYQYDFSVPQKAISHLVIETSLSFAEANLLNFSELTSLFESVDVGEFAQNNSNPGIPSEIYGIKIDTDGESLNVSISFISNRAPVWGDFYAKDGVDGSNNVYAYNTGFASEDPKEAPSNGSINNHLLVPDTIPEPSVVLLSFMGALMLFKRRRI